MNIEVIETAYKTPREKAIEHLEKTTPLPAGWAIQKDNQAPILSPKSCLTAIDIAIEETKRELIGGKFLDLINAVMGYHEDDEEFCQNLWKDYEKIADKNNKKSR